MPNGFLKIRVNKAAEARWRAAAGGDGKLSPWLRGVADLAAAGATDPGEVRDALVGLRADLNKGVGNNLNQIARAINADLLAGRPSPAGTAEAALSRAADELAAMRAVIQQVLDRLTSRHRPSRSRRPGIKQSPETAIPSSRDDGIP